MKNAIKQLEYAFLSASKLESQHILVIAGREAKPLLEAAEEHPGVARQAANLLQQVTRFEARIPALRKQIRKQVSSVPFAPPQLTIRAFGEGEVYMNGESVTSTDWVSRKPVRELFFCLLAHPDGLTKEEIGAIFWPESSPNQLKLRFKNNIYWLRHALENEVVLFEGNCYRFNDALDYDYDVETFSRNLEHAQNTNARGEKIAAYQRVMQLYQGRYLPDIDQKWTALEREHLHLSYLKAGINLGRLQLEDQDYQGALETSKRLLQEDDCLEPAHRLAMRAHAALGDINAVARQFERCQERLRDELDVPPSEETSQLLKILIP